MFIRVKPSMYNRDAVQYKNNKYVLKGFHAWSLIYSTRVTMQGEGQNAAVSCVYINVM